MSEDRIPKLPELSHSQGSNDNTVVEHELVEFYSHEAMEQDSATSAQSEISSDGTDSGYNAIMDPNIGHITSSFQENIAEAAQSFNHDMIHYLGGRNHYQSLIAVQAAAHSSSVGEGDIDSPLHVCSYELEKTRLVVQAQSLVLTLTSKMMRKMEHQGDDAPPPP
uniref:Uncharacterized protein n=1 Tax=Timema bartmani TaxID=61472 RepID=A0A7R9I515_9NEOP|nr:unnamed protein product [Timema bartmani]